MSHLKRKEYKFSIYDNNGFIHLKPMKRGINFQFLMIIDLFIPHLKKENINFQFVIIIDLFISC